MGKRIYLDTVHRLAGEAMAGGAERTGLCSIKWDLAGNCQAPVSRTVTARPSASNSDPQITVDAKRATKAPFWVDLELRCRRCDPCRELRRALWAARARAETAAAVRTWFGTLTLSPEHHTKTLAKARLREAAQGVDFDALAYGEQFICRHAVISPEITKYLKRLRKAMPRPIRSLIVAEAHKSGLPHYHVLLHETHPEGMLRHSVLQAQWQLGFSAWKLVTDPKQAAYLCKYLSKSTAARVRASVAYGKDVLEHSFFNPLKKREGIDPSIPERELVAPPTSERVGSLTGNRLDCDSLLPPGFRRSDQPDQTLVG